MRKTVRRPRAQRRKSGFSLLELMIAMGILAVVTIFLTDMLIRQSRAYQVVENVSETQQNLRAVAHLLERELRTTGYMVPEVASFCGIDVPSGNPYPDTDPDVLVVSDATSLEWSDQKSQDLGAVILAGSYAGNGSNEVLTVDDVVLDDEAYYDTSGDGAADSDFLYGTSPDRHGGVMVVDRANPERGVSCGIIEEVDAAAGEITVDFTLGSRVPAGTPLAAAPAGSEPEDLVAVPAHVYWIEDGALMRDGMVLAEDVEDLQIAAFFDEDLDGEVDGRPDDDPPLVSEEEYPGSRREGEVSGEAYEPHEWDNRFLREIRVTLVGRTKKEDPQVAADPSMAVNRAQTVENRRPSNTDDGFRRRVVTVTVRPRNVGFRQTGG